MSEVTRKYGRNVPAPLPEHRMLSFVDTRSLPPVVDLRPWAGPVKDQGSEGSCTAHAGSSAMEWIFRRYLSKAPVFSPQFLYVEELLHQGSFPEDVGSDGTTLCETMIFKGCCEERLFPYVAGELVAPTPEQVANAAQYRLGAYHGIPNADVALTVLGDPVPWPVEIGFNVYESFESPQTAASGVMQVPRSGEQLLGGHEVLLLGYDIGIEPTLRPQSAPPSMLVLNSWGTGWGLSGYFWMPLAILNDSNTDLKIAHAGRPWR